MITVLLLIVIAILLFGSAAIFGAVDAMLGMLTFAIAVTMAAWMLDVPGIVVFLGFMVALLALHFWLSRSAPAP